MYSPPATGVPPSNLLRALISSVGPAIKLVPVSAMAWQPPLQKVFPFAITLKSNQNAHKKGGCTKRHQQFLIKMNFKNFETFAILPLIKTMRKQTY